MTRIARFEDLVAWQRGRELTRATYAVTGRGPLAKDFALVQQLRRAAVSVMANIAEGFDRGGRGEFHQFRSTAKGSCAEVRSHFYVAFDAGHIDREQFDRLLSDTDELSRIIGGPRSAVARQRQEQRERSQTHSSVLSPRTSGRAEEGE